MTDGVSATQKSSRIPLALQAVFLASNRGKEVHQPPPDKSASKVFFGNWLFQRRGNGKQKEAVSHHVKSPSTKDSIVSATMHSPSSLSSEEKPVQKEYTVHFKMHRQDNPVTNLSVSNHSLRSSKRTVSTRSVDSTLSISSTEREVRILIH